MIVSVEGVSTETGLSVHFAFDTESILFFSLARVAHDTGLLALTIVFKHAPEKTWSGVLIHERQRTALERSMRLESLNALFAQGWPYTCYLCGEELLALDGSHKADCFLNPNQKGE